MYATALHLAMKVHLLRHHQYFCRRFQEIWVRQDKLDAFLIRESNIIYESACFHQRRQMPCKLIKQFMTAPHVLANKCDFGKGGKHLVRDRFVLCLRDDKLSESLQMDAKLSLAIAMEKARLKQTVQQEQEVSQL